MEFTADEKGLFAKKLFKKITVAYEDIGSITALSAQKTLIKTKSGDEYIDEEGSLGLTQRFPAVFDMIVRHNIPYKYQGMVEANIVGVMDRAGVDEYVDKFIDEINPQVRDILREKLGEDFTPEFIVREVHQETMLYIKLLKNGEVISVDGRTFDDPEADMTDVFDFAMLAYLGLWDSETKSGKYVVLDETDEILEGAEIHCEECYKKLVRDGLV